MIPRKGRNTPKATRRRNWPQPYQWSIPGVTDAKFYEFRQQCEKQQ